MYGFDSQTICLFLEKIYGITISLRTLKRRLADHRLNKIGSDISDVGLQVTIEREVITVSRDKVMEMLQNIYPVYSALREARKLSVVL